MSTAKSCCRFAYISCDISGVVYMILMGHNIFLYRVLLRGWFYRSNYKSLDKHVFKNVTVSSLARYVFPHLRNYVLVSVLEPLGALIVTQHNLWTESIFYPFLKVVFLRLQTTNQNTAESSVSNFLVFKMRGNGYVAFDVQWLIHFKIIFCIFVVFHNYCLYNCTLVSFCGVVYWQWGIEKLKTHASVVKV
jgi:hypothetical protein